MSNTFLQSHHEAQVLYMPGILELCDEGVAPITTSANDIVNDPTAEKNPSPASPTDDQPEHKCMWLPSAIPWNMHKKTCVAGVIVTETHMQLVLMHDSLNSLCCLLCISSTIRADKWTNEDGTSQQVGTRTQTVLKRFAEKIHRTASCSLSSSVCCDDIVGPNRQLDKLLGGAQA